MNAAMIPLPHQTIGAEFLAAREAALLADHPRVGKTGAAIMATDLIAAKRILVVTTASGRPVWTRGFRDWSGRSIRTEAVYGALPDITGPLRLVVSWSEIDKHADWIGLLRWDVLVLDESHYAKAVDAKRTQAVYGTFRGLARTWGLCDQADRTWCLTGTPIPNAPNDLYPMLRTLAPERLHADPARGWPDVQDYGDFLHRYCVVRKKAISRWTKIDVVVGGRNLDELKARMDRFWLRRTQKDVGVTTPVYEIMPLHVADGLRRQIEGAVPGGADILDAAETGETRGLDMHLGTLRRLTGNVKARSVVQAVKEDFECGLDKVVLMAWHTEVLDLLQTGLSEFGVVRLDGSTHPDDRETAVQRFRTDAGTRVFLGQIVAAGEAIDLSVSSELIFVESSFTPKDMSQAAMRITNLKQTRQPRVRVAALEGSIDEALQSIIVRKMKSIREVLA